MASFSFLRTFVRHWRESMHYFGLRRSLSGLAAALWSVLVELMPSRRKARYGDLDYDLDHSVDTTRVNVSFRTQVVATLTGNQYFPTEPWIFEQIMQALPINFPDFTFIDLGSGKGRCLLMAAERGFKRIVGLELLPKLHQAAEENIRNSPPDISSRPRLQACAQMFETFIIPPNR
ncbi:MAG: class I SAM-dependent methyltransferase [Candidatus Angelobacter sp.]